MSALSSLVEDVPEVGVGEGQRHERRALGLVLDGRMATRGIGNRQPEGVAFLHLELGSRLLEVGERDLTTRVGDGSDDLERLPKHRLTHLGEGHLDGRVVSEPPDSSATRRLGILADEIRALESPRPDQLIDKRPDKDGMVGHRRPPGRANRRPRTLIRRQKGHLPPESGARSGGRTRTPFGTRS